MVPIAPPPHNLDIKTWIMSLMIFVSADLVVNALVGSSYATAERVTVGKMIIRTKNVREIKNVQAPRLPAGPAKASGIYAFLDQRVAMA